GLPSAAGMPIVTARPRGVPHRRARDGGRPGAKSRWAGCGRAPMRNDRDHERIAHGGQAVYGARPRNLMVEARFPRIPGDMGHAGTWPFPVLYKVVKGASPRRVVIDAASGLVASFIEAARELEALGADGITTNCGFLSLYQRELAAAVTVPV